ncbi:MULTISPECIES: hypothetical protein [unclassified Spiroplasma]|uniref:hypothetical protein n=1 Tax=unclassified Spiroplasma TaxID=2637901 RepID=UPI0030CC5FB5
MSLASYIVAKSPASILSLIVWWYCKIKLLLFSLKVWPKTPAVRKPSAFLK